MTEKQEELIPPALNLFQVHPKVCGIQDVQWIDYRPVSQPGGDSALIFDISGSGPAYTDLSRTYLHLRARITNKGAPITPDEGVSTVNLWLHSLFSQCDITLQQKMLYNSGRFYVYKSYIETLLNLKTDLATNLVSEMFYKDDRYAMDAYNPKDVKNINTGLLLRFQRVKNGYWVEMMGPLHADLCQMDRLILNGVDIGVKMYPTSTAFNLMSGADYAPIFKIEIDSAVLKVCKVTIEPDVFTAQTAVLESGITAKYPIRNTEINTHVIPKGATSWNQTDIFQNRVPTFMVIGLVSAAAFHGDFKKNPFAFYGWDLSTLTILRNGQMIPFKPLRMDFSTGECIEAYRTLIKDNDRGTNITLDDFLNGYALYVYRLDDQAYDYACIPQTQNGNLAIEAQFAKALPENLNIVIYASFSGMLQIDKFRAVST